MNFKAAAVLLMLAVSSPSWGLYQMPIPQLDYGRELLGEIRLKKNNEVLVRESINISRSDKYIVFDSRAEGKTEDGKPISSRELDHYLVTNGKMTIHSVNFVSEKSGKPWQSYQVSFDWDKKEAYSVFRDEERNRTVNKTIKLTPKTLPSRGISPYVTNMIKNGVKEDKIRMIIATGDTFGMDIRIDYEPVTITINGREKNCYHVRLRPDMGLLSHIIPFIDFWFDADPPHRFQRYIGPEKGPGSPDIIQQILND